MALAVRRWPLQVKLGISTRREPQLTAQSLAVALCSHHDPAWSQPACPEACMVPYFGPSCCPARVPEIFPTWSPVTLTKGLSLLLEGMP